MTNEYITLLHAELEKAKKDCTNYPTWNYAEGYRDGLQAAYALLGQQVAKDMKQT